VKIDTSDVARAMLWALAGDKSLHDLDTFSTPDDPAFGGRQAFAKKNDVFFEAVQGVISKAVAIATAYDKQTMERSKPLGVAFIAFPLIVVDGALFEAGLDEQAQDISVREIEFARLHWRGAEYGPPHTTVDIVSAKALPHYAEKRGQEIDRMIGPFRKTLQQITECWSQGTLAPLEITKGSRGVLGLPPLLSLITDRPVDH